MKTSTEHIAPRGSCRILYVSDPSSIATNLLPEPVRPEALRNWVDMVADSGVDIFDQEIFSQGWTAYWRSERDEYEYDRRRQHRRFIPMLDAGTQPLDILIDQAHKRGMRFVAGFRMNDNHAYQARQQGLSIAQFIEDNPQWCLTEFPAGELYKQGEPLDFTFAEVRDFTFGVIEEVASRFDIDGVELCFRDFAYFPPSTGEERMHLMTELIQRIRAMLIERGRVNGTKFLLGARVFSTIAECRNLGLDVPTWIDDGLLDYVCPQDVMYCDFNLPLESWSALTRASECMLYPAILPWTSYRARYRLGNKLLSDATCRAMAQTFYGAGVDGISIFNHFCAMSHPPFYPHQMQVFHELRDPQKVAAGERHYVFDPTWAGLTGFGGDGIASTGAHKARKLVLDRSAPHPTGEYRFQLYEDLQGASGATLLFRGFGLTANDELEVVLNGHTIPGDRIGRTAGSDTEGHVRASENGGVMCHPERGRIDLRGDAMPPFSTRWFSLSPSTVVFGQNCLTLTLTQSDSTASDGQIVVDELEIWVHPK